MVKAIVDLSPPSTLSDAYKMQLQIFCRFPLFFQSFPLDIGASKQYTKKEFFILIC